MPCSLPLVLLLLQAGDHEPLDSEIAKHCLEAENSYAWEQADADGREEKVRWLAGKVRELEVKSWVLTRTLPKALQAGMVQC